MNNQNTSNMPEHNNNHAAIHENLWLENNRPTPDAPDDITEEEGSLPLTINGKINGHGPYDYI